jgi:hypothetical protein
MSSVAETPLLSDRAVVGAYDPAEPPRQSFEYMQPAGGRVAIFELRGARWADDVASRLRELMRLPRDWDTYGGIAVKQTSAAQALWFLTRFLEPGSAAPWVVPLSDGGVQFEWHREGVDVEIVFSPEEGDEASVVDQIHGVTWEGEPEDVLYEPVRSLLHPVLSSLRA